MRFALMLEPQQGLSYGDHVAIAKRAEANGFETLFRSDHYASFPGPAGRPTTDAWSVLAGLARETDRIGLGVLVSPVTFRHPGNFAKVVTTVDEMSGGRIEVGVGAGWNELEHRQLGLPFPPITERADLLEDQLAILHGLWGEPDGWSYDGHQVTIRGRAVPSEAGRRPGPTADPDRWRAPATARRRSGVAALLPARGALRGRVQPQLRERPTRRAQAFAAVDAACVAIGRDPATVTHSAMIGVLDRARRGRDGRRGSRRPPRRSGRMRTTTPGSKSGSTRWVTGTPDEARAAVRRYAAAGVERIMLQDFLPVGPRHDRRHGRGPRRAGLGGAPAGWPRQPAASARR